jgi:hypothetical protein
MDTSTVMESDTNETHRQNGAGCGVGLYALLLLGICLVGVLGICSATIGLINSEPEEARNLVHVSEVQVWRLQPMRKAGLLKLTEVPAAWHDESFRFDGTTACVLTANGAGRIEEGVGTFFTWPEITKTEVERTSATTMSIIVHNNESAFTCLFGPNEGAERFLRQIEAERQGETEASD